MSPRNLNVDISREKRGRTIAAWVSWKEFDRIQTIVSIQETMISKYLKEAILGKLSEDERLLKLQNEISKP